MGKFDGIMLASDWDGTLFHEGDISRENKEAIQYFMENGGRFTICSGRYFDFLKSHRDKITPNTYSICLNGAYIADTETAEVLYSGVCDGRLFEYIELFFLKTNLYSKIYLYPSDSRESSMYSVDEYVKSIDEIKKHDYYKAVLYAQTDKDGKAGKELAKKHRLDGYCAVRSFAKSLEILKTENTKGFAIKRLAKHLGAKLTVAVGDYENDIPMILAADIGYAVANATDEVKEVADRITVSCADSAIAKVIWDIEFEILPNLSK